MWPRHFNDDPPTGSRRRINPPHLTHSAAKALSSPARLLHRFPVSRSPPTPPSVCPSAHAKPPSQTAVGPHSLFQGISFTKSVIFPIRGGVRALLAVIMPPRCFPSEHNDPFCHFERRFVNKCVYLHSAHDARCHVTLGPAATVITPLTRRNKNKLHTAAAAPRRGHISECRRRGAEWHQRTWLTKQEKMASSRPRLYRADQKTRGRGNRRSSPP